MLCLIWSHMAGATPFNKLHTDEGRQWNSEWYRILSQHPGGQARTLDVFVNDRRKIDSQVYDLLSSTFANPKTLMLAEAAGEM